LHSTGVGAKIAYSGVGVGNGNGDGSGMGSNAVMDIAVMPPQRATQAHLAWFDIGPDSVVMSRRA
jgi:hypothetical protein